METIGPYRLLRKVGEGGMGVVYEARDERLDRSIAIKVIRNDAGDDARQRMWREARAAASVNHPNICQIYDIGEHGAGLFVAMELLDGEPLSERIARGALPVREAIDVMCGVLDALEALHSRQIVHRDLKPSNIFLTPRGVKLLDFGLALPLAATDLRLTTPGMLVGTPRYMAPEQWSGASAVPATDLFACGAILYEMVTGRPAFDGDSLASVCHAVTNAQPPVLTGGNDIRLLDQAIHRALSKRAEERFATAAEMAAALRQAKAPTEETMKIGAVATAKRLIVLPFRLLRPDPEIDFLSFSLADAITTSLCGLEHLVVRSARVAARFGGDEPDPRALASEAEVDAALVGTLLRAGDQVRLKTQLIETPSGTVVWSKTLQVAMNDIFQLEDELRDGVLQSLSITLSPAEHRQIEQLAAPPRSRAYELYLRATDLGFSTVSSSRIIAARDLYRSSVEEDPSFAPAWARLGRAYRIIAKYGHGDAAESLRLAGEAFQRAFELNSDLPLAHSYYTYYELEELGRAPEAVMRLLGRVEAGVADADVYAGLVTALRFVGLYDGSLAADERARRIDPTIRTSIQYTHWMRGDMDRAAALDRDEIPIVRALALANSGRANDALEQLDRAVAGVQGTEELTLKLYLAALRGDRMTATELSRRLSTSGFHDPEGFFFLAMVLAHVGADEEAIHYLSRAIAGNYYCAHAIIARPELARLREAPAIETLLVRSRELRDRARGMFDAHGGAKLLGLES